jgi:hypothetical protein
MRHVDEGTIHAWLDGQITDPAAVAWIEEHLRWCEACGARLAEERAMLEQANALLALAAPAAEPPAFDDLVAKAGQSMPAADSISGVKASGGGRWVLQLGWAASLAMAVGLGWMARDMAERQQAAPRIGATDRAAESVSSPGLPEHVAGPSAGSVAAPAAGVVATLPGASGSTDVLPDRPVEQQAAVATRPEPGPPERLGGNPPEALERARERLANAPPPRVAFESARRQVQAVTAGAPAAASQALAPSAPAAAPIAAPAAPGAAPPAAGPVAVTGNIAAPPALTRTEWQPPVARTEAAARSGMALYGVAGLTPAFTAISADGRVVRTMYFLESGALLEMEQQRATPDRPLDLAAQAAQARSAVASQRPEGLAADAAEPQQRTWSTVRGNVRVTLRTPSAATDLEALGMRLRLD